MDRKRDSQRSRVYAWEQAFFGERHHVEFTFDELVVFICQVWGTERGRVGLANVPVPKVTLRRGNSARAWPHRIAFSARCHNRLVALHEIAHCLTPGDRHGTRFTGVLIGLYCRHAGCEASAMMAAADAGGVRYSIRSIGTVPVEVGSEAKARVVVRRAQPAFETATVEAA